MLDQSSNKIKLDQSPTNIEYTFQHFTLIDVIDVRLKLKQDQTSEELQHRVVLQAHTPNSNVCFVSVTSAVNA